MVDFHDLSLTAKIKAMLARTEGLKAMDINVDVANGIVCLKGNVSQEEHDKALNTVKRLGGVKSVEDDMSITSGA